jgi:hypothetical protein
MVCPSFNLLASSISYHASFISICKTNVEMKLNFLVWAVMAESSFASANVQWPTGITVSYPNSSAFTDATTRWNAYGSPGFSASVTPTSAKEVADIVGQLPISRIWIYH